MPDHKYETITRSIRDQVDRGELRPGDRLPSQEALGEQYGASRIVVRQALSILEGEGVIDTTQGAGSFVRRHQPLVRRSSLHYKVDPGTPFADEVLATERLPHFSHRTWPAHADGDIAARLGIPVGADVMCTEYVAHADGDPILVVTSFEPVVITGGTIIARPEEGPLKGAGLVDRFAAVGRQPTVVVERLRARMPRPSEAELMNLPPGSPVIVAVRTTYCELQPLETADMLFDAQRYELEYAITV